MSELSDCARFLQRLIEVRSLPGEEGEAAALVQQEMERLGYDRVWRDEAGSVIGLIRGRGEAPALMLNTHLDHVDVGDEGAWPHPPFAAEVAEGRVWGRGAVDIKGPLAAQVHGAARLPAEGTRPAGDVLVSAVVQEEVGGLGARHLVSHLQPPLVVIGEPSGNRLRRGHRGRTEAVLHVTGRSVHASVPERGANPLEVVAGFIAGLSRVERGRHPDLGTSSVAPTLIRTDQRSPNVVPAEVWLTCDWRNVPGETGAQIRERLEALAIECLIEGTSARVEIPLFERCSYRGLQMTIPADNPAYSLPADHPVLAAAAGVLREAVGLEEPPGVWHFATDGGHFAQAGLTVIGYGPGEEGLAHTIQESIRLDELEEAVRAYRALALEWAPRVERPS